MAIRTLKIEVDHKFHQYLVEAESLVDALSEVELDEAEARLRLKISSFVADPHRPPLAEAISLNTLRHNQRAASRWLASLVIVFCSAALALIFFQNSQGCGLK